MIGNSEEQPVGFDDPEPAPAGPDQTTMIINALRQHVEAIAQLQHQVAQMAQQRSINDVQMERHLRATALDLAIKALPESGGVGLTVLADAFVGWLKASPASEQQVQ